MRFAKFFRGKEYFAPLLRCSFSCIWIFEHSECPSCGDNILPYCASHSSIRRVQLLSCSENVREVLLCARSVHAPKLPDNQHISERPPYGDTVFAHCAFVQTVWLLSLSVNVHNVFLHACSTRVLGAVPRKLFMCFRFSVVARRLTKI